MSDTFTPNLNLTQPQVGSSSNTWGNKLNADLAAIDALFATTGTGTVVTRDSANDAVTSGVKVSQAAGNSRLVKFLSGTSLRWQFGANNTAEAGSNVGSDLALVNYADDGTTQLGTPLSVNRATSVLTFGTTPLVGVNQVIHQGNAASLLPTPPIGSFQPYLGTSDPDIYHMIMDGRAISRTTYSALFALIGTTYGAGDGSTTFNIPNTAELTLVGRAATASRIPQYSLATVGSIVGEGQHALTGAENGPHNHTATSTVTDPQHTHLGTAGDSFVVQNSGSGFSGTSSGAGGVDDSFLGHIASASTGITVATSIASNGSGTAHNNVQPSLVVNFVLRVL